MRIPIAIVGHATSPRVLQAFVDATTLVDRAMIREGSYAPLYTSGIRYRNERRGGAFPGVERFQTLSSSHDVGYDDCDGLAPARAAELLEQGVNARAYAVRSPGVGWHVVVLRRDGAGRVYVEDPSARLGMLEPRNDEPMRNERPFDDSRVQVLGVHATHRGRCVAAVGAIAPDGSIFTGIGAADVDPVAPPASARRQARARAARGALSALAQRATQVYTAPATAALSAAQRGAAAATATRANRARADVDTLEQLDVDDTQNEEDVEGVDPWAWRMYELR